MPRWKRKILEAALEAGADDVVNEAGESSVLCAPDSFEAVQQALPTPASSRTLPRW